MNNTSLLHSFELPHRCLLKQREHLDIALIGCGGTGSHLAQALATTLYHLRQRGEVAVSLTLIDGDDVEEKNVGRQRFCAAEIGRNKAETLAWRLNAAYGLKVRAVPEYLTVERGKRWLPQTNYSGRSQRLIIGCVDNAAARGAIVEFVKRPSSDDWWLDCGNAEFNGQVLIGNLSPEKEWKLPDLDMGLFPALPAPHWQEPDLLDAANDIAPEQNCALAAARDEQSLMINMLNAAIAAQYVYQWAVLRELSSMATYFSGWPPVMHSRSLTMTNLSPYLTVPEKESADEAVNHRVG